MIASFARQPFAHTAASLFCFWAGSAEIETSEGCTQESQLCDAAVLEIGLAMVNEVLPVSIGRETSRIPEANRARHAPARSRSAEWKGWIGVPHHPKHCQSDRLGRTR